ncbi:hypothetical protein ACB094_04G008500 [Castanea mollissima]
MGCGSFSSNAKLDFFLPKLDHHLRLPTWQQSRLGTIHSSPQEELDSRVYFWLVLNHTYSTMELCKMKSPAHTAILGANCTRSCTCGERLSTPGIGVYQDKDSGRVAECRNNALEEFKPRLPNRQCSKKCSKQSRQCSNLKQLYYL